MSKFTAEEKAAEAEREVSMRYRVYPRKNNGGPMTPEQLRAIACMNEIAEEYRARVVKENDLFTSE